MKTDDFIKNSNLNNSVLIGYYGGGNFGDELLLETLQVLFSENKLKNVSIIFSGKGSFASQHKDYGYKVVERGDIRSVFSSIVSSDNIVVGGGGLWGLDYNSKILVLSSLLLFSRFILRKKVYLIGVGYYGSTSKGGRISAWLAARAANKILARDDETLKNFEHMKGNVVPTSDIAFSLSTRLNVLARQYGDELGRLESGITLSDDMVLVGHRWFPNDKKDIYSDYLTKAIEKHQSKNFIVSNLIPERLNRAGHANVENRFGKLPNVQIVDFDFNPIALVLFLNKYSKKIILVAPQYHAILSASIANVRFFPLIYDNKVAELLRAIGVKQTYPVYKDYSSPLDSFLVKRGD